jgi:tRNA nucleotidyltransferase/poly(A) polymerase
MTSATQGARRQAAHQIVVALRAAGHEAFWAGGSVRDLVRGQEPKDYDIATSAAPEEVMGLFPKTVGIGVSFGVVRVVRPEGQFEVATFRTEEGYADGRRPDRVAWADARADVARRDFTINGMLYDPIAEEVIDWVGGQADLAAGIIRSIGNPRERFREDRLRLLRAVRFAARLGFGIEVGTWEAVREAAPEIRMVSAERVHDELQRLLTEGGAARGLELLMASGLAHQVVPWVADLTRACRRFERVDACGPAFGWGLLLADAPGAVPAAAEVLRWSNRLASEVQGALGSLEELHGYPRLPGLAAKKRALRRPEAGLALELAGVLAAAGQAPLEPFAQALADRSAWDQAALHPKPLLTGKDLIAAGLQPGPHFATLLVGLETAQLEGEVTDPEGAWALLRRLAQAAG